jgi:predicted Fe-Mo cluster-binding NifX family protein
MRIIIPTNSEKGLNDIVANHFGRCETYTLINEKGELIKVIKNTSEHMGGIGLPPELMKKNKANVLLCKSLGFRALKLCEKYKIKVYTNQALTVKEIFNLWKNNKLKEAGNENACKEHGT